ncbi:hypothetical protein F5J12DRAFT_555154 [Pisolithus orientalis]|uniref:uncharacterized protein n=1 Tax=Pisolithus orientalis TaxID=936130 RepID=UPI0022240A3C|nr:uncharacterized protein F5J12DRAFT_555154 [Pisolithus orientalis]KAI5987409.1 hypothetical protein F5J12DRAFT_555154 [Pisolithus orientalis]
MTMVTDGTCHCSLRPLKEDQKQHGMRYCCFSRIHLRRRHDFSLSRSTLKRMPPRLPDGCLVLQSLADFLLKEFRDEGRDGGLDTIIALARTAVEFAPPGHPRLHTALINLIDLLSERCKKVDTKVDLDEMITLRRAALESVPQNHPRRRTILLELDDCLYERFKKGDDMADLEAIVSLRWAMLECTPQPDQCRTVLNLANSLLERFEKLGLATDVKEAINLGRTALELCPLGHPDRTLSQDCLANYLDAKSRKQGAQARARIAGARGDPSSSADIWLTIKKIVFETVEKIPLRLLHTSTGVLCNRDALLSLFEGSLEYGQLPSSMTACDGQRQEALIRETVTRFFKFATLSHRWGSAEPILRDVEGKSIYDLDGGDGLEKLQRFCALALRRGFLWAWSDTCCIDKDSSAELQEAIGSMFFWYRSSSLTLVHLCDVCNTDFLANSVWFKRGWTLQELLASRAVLFYTQDWSLYMNRESANHKTDPALLEEVEKATGIEKQHLIDFYPGLDNARSRLHWASVRSTTRPEDIAYSLFGIFKIHLPVLYGESVENALGRLLAEIISRSGDISVLDWAGEASSFNSCFPANLVPYQTVPDIQLTPSNPAKHDDLDPEKAQKLYNNLARLPRAGFVNSKLVLPCTVHPATVVKLQGTSTRPSDRYTYTIHASRLTPLELALSANLDEGAGRYVLVRPWHPKALPTQSGGDDDAMWELLEQLKQPFNTLLLEKSRHNEYRRIASDCMITAYPQDLTSVLDSQVLIPEIV